MNTPRDIFDALDNAPLTCFLSGTGEPDILYGPFPPEQAADFIGVWNEFFAERNMPGVWVARPLIGAESLPTL